MNLRWNLHLITGVFNWNRCLTRTIDSNPCIWRFWGLEVTWQITLSDRWHLSKWQISLFVSVKLFYEEIFTNSSSNCHWHLTDVKIEFDSCQMRIWRLSWRICSALISLNQNFSLKTQLIQHFSLILPPFSPPSLTQQPFKEYHPQRRLKKRCNSIRFNMILYNDCY